MTFLSTLLPTFMSATGLFNTSAYCKSNLYYRAVLMAIPLLLLPCQLIAGENHAQAEALTQSDLTNADLNKAEQEHAAALIITPSQRQLANIQVETLTFSPFDLTSVATAQLVVDKDKTVTIAPQLAMQVLKRHVVPGQQVVKGQALLTLGGTEIAQAQADYINAATEWQRVSRMSKGTISASEKMRTEVNAELKRAVLNATMMTNKQILTLTTSPQSIGQFQLLAPISGRVQQDEAMLGQVLEAGTPLMQLTDESFLWVEAQLTPRQSERVDIGQSALVRVGQRNVTGVVIGRSHELNAITRTEQVWISMANPQHVLHAGEFAELYFQQSDPKGDKSAQTTALSSLNGIIVPDSALTRSSDGDWQIFVENKEGFEAVEIEVLQSQRGLNLITGIESGSQVVVSGAFFLASELAKSGFDIHNH
ncbi:efflux RND transporter periplasmic adaptor subunit [Shewanella sp. OMA3-2]|uniref:efflux RND transporter periplasmic adaptor subunit n=1 Tax=Shewanella sp. OMA3-2 TaxID=2908650 RepID=UPI001F170727|nr:efflux RND transporter periplasmic adaptor subunit [Shewanella sp. OMA3-2]UJF22639.1 efflux RND transporter periplasmic adaptor subunit [Shewanella sp. OMA3-2]